MRHTKDDEPIDQSISQQTQLHFQTSHNKTPHKSHTNKTTSLNLKAATTHRIVTTYIYSITDVI
jgi:hypothetical protein